jgi:SAM-dependent methyltransferase
MSDEIKLHPTRCPICDTEGNETELYPADFDFAAFNPAIYSARRLPDRVHYRIVRCNTCALVRSDPVADPQLLAQLYARSSFDYELEVDDLRRTYGRYLDRLERFGVCKGSLLEIGCGNGFFLEEALRLGYSSVHGVEPSRAAIDRAREDIRPNIICDVLRPGLFEPECFDVIAIFQTFDHISDPGALLDECRRLLKPGGLMLCFNHNIAAASAGLLGERSPIIDIEHTYLYSPATISRLFEKHAFQTIETGSARNTYHLYYLTRLVPLPALLKKPLLRLLKDTRFGSIRLTVPLGNLFIIARKP